MSLTARIKSVPITDLAALQAAVAELRGKGKNIEVVYNARPRMHMTDTSPLCPIVLKLHDGQYDVGLEKQPDGSYGVVLDTWNNHVSSVIGAACPLPQSYEDRTLHCIGQFMQAYSKHAAINAAIEQGHRVESCEVNSQGEVVLTIAAD